VRVRIKMIMNLFTRTKLIHSFRFILKGILEIGSPAWCLKTKSNWDNYQAKYPEQWVATENRFLKNNNS
jgi:hypothetical protein